MVEYPSPLEVFCSYAHKDEVWLHKLMAHLRLLEREGLVLIWHDRLLTSGTDWAQEIDVHLNRAQLILLLISPDFVASDYCYSIEMQRALERHEANEARVVPILVRRVGNWQIAPFARLQALPSGKFLVEWSEREEDIPLSQIATGIHETLKDLRTSAASEPRARQPSIWNIPYPRNPLFIGREAQLQAIEAALNRGQHTAIAQAQAISGLGGMGKTQLALEYVYRHQATYRSVFWALAETRDTLNASYSEIATLLKLPERYYPEQSLMVAAVKRWFATNQDWLLVLDNADDLRMIRGFLPASVPGHLVLTTHAHAMGGLAERIEVKKLEEEEGCLLLLHRSGLLSKDAPLETLALADREAADEIVRELDGLPLALDQAGAYIEETNCSVQDYLDLYRANRAELLRLRGGLIDDHPEPVATTWQLAFDRLEQRNGAAADLLRLCAFLAPDDIPETIISQGMSELTPSLQQLAKHPLQWNAALAVLQGYSLVTRHPDTHTLDVHRLVQAVQRDAMTKEEERTWAERAVQAMAYLFPWPEAANWEQCRHLLPHAQMCVRLIEYWQMVSREGARLLHNVGWYLRERGEYHEAQRHSEQALAIRREVLGELHPDTAASLDKRACAYYDQGKYPEAEQVQMQALAIRRKVLGELHPSTARSLSNLALVYDAQDKYTEAEEAYIQALAILRKVLGEEHPDTANSINNLALVYAKQGRYPEAEQAHLQALAIYRKALGEEHPDTAMSLNNLGELYAKQGRYPEAEQAYLQALEIYREALGEEHPDTAMSLNNLGELYAKQGRYLEAEQAHLQALAIYREALGEEHPDTAMSLNNLGELYAKQGRYLEAEQAHLQALAIYREALGEEHPDTAMSLNNLGELYAKQGRYLEAEQAHLQALAIYREALGEEHPDTAMSLNNLGELYAAEKRYSDALSLFERALTIRQNALHPEHPDTKETQRNLEQTLQAMQQDAEEPNM